MLLLIIKAKIKSIPMHKDWLENKHESLKWCKRQNSQALKKQPLHDRFVIPRDEFEPFVQLHDPLIKGRFGFMQRKLEYQTRCDRRHRRPRHQDEAIHPEAFRLKHGHPSVFSILVTIVSDLRKGGPVI